MGLWVRQKMWKWRGGSKRSSSTAKVLTFHTFLLLVLTVMSEMGGWGGGPPQLLANQLTLSYQGGNIMPTLYYWYPQLFSSSSIIGVRWAGVCVVGLTEAACSFLCDEAVVVWHDLRDHLDSGNGGGDGGGYCGAATNMPPLLCPPAPLK